MKTLIISLFFSLSAMASEPIKILTLDYCKELGTLTANIYNDDSLYTIKAFRDYHSIHVYFSTHELMAIDTCFAQGKTPEILSMKRGPGADNHVSMSTFRCVSGDMRHLQQEACWYCSKPEKWNVKICDELTKKYGKKIVSPVGKCKLLESFR